MNELQEKPTVGVSQGAREIGMNEDYLRKEAKEGKIQHFYEGKQIRLVRSSLREYAAKRRK